MQTQICEFCHPSAAGDLTESVSVDIDDVSIWMRANWLQLNHSYGLRLHVSHMIPTGAVRISDTSVICPGSRHLRQR